MLILLTGIYCGIVWLIFYKFKLLEFTKPRKIAVTVLGICGLLYLLIALGRYMPSMSGTASVMNPSVEIRADVGGRVVKVWVTKPGSVKKGDPLFQVQPDTYEFAYEQARAALRQAEQDVEGMKATLDQDLAAVEQAKSGIDTAKAARDTAGASVTTARSQINGAKEDLAAAAATVAQTRATLDYTRSQAAMVVKAGKSDAVSKFQIEEAEKKVESLEAQLEGDLARERKAKVNLEETLPSQLEGAKAKERQAGTQVRQAEDVLTQSEAAARKARLALESTIDGKHTIVRQAEEALDLAKWNLDHTTLVAPEDGWIYNPQVRVGTYVRILDRVMSFTAKSDQFIVAPVGQFSAALIGKGDAVELTFPMYPGRVFTAEVERVALVTGESQAVVSGQLPTTGSLAPAQSYLVRIMRTDVDPERPFYPGMGGTAAVYTQHGKAFHIIRKVIIRIEAWLNYLPG